MTITVLSDLDGFRTVRGEWNALLERSGNSTLFLCWEWVFFYCTHMCGDQELLVLLVTNAEGKLTGVAPFILRQGRIVTKWTFLEIIGQQHSYYLGIIADCNCRDDVYREVFAYLLENRKKWDLIDFVHLSDDVEFKTYLRQHTRGNGYYWREGTKDPCKVVRLPKSFDEYVTSLDKSISKKVKYSLRSINRDFDVDVSLPNDEKSLLELWKKFIELHESRVHSKGGKTVLSNKGFQEFYYSVASAAYRERNLRLVTLKLDSEIAAVLFGVVWNRTFYFLNIGYREYSKYSLGLLLPVMCIERAINDGLEYFDFLGRGGDYKEKLGGVDKGGLSIQVMKPMTLLEAMAKTGAKRVAKKMLKRGMLGRTKKGGLP